jgi:SAM-dependent methyltransferase
MLRERGVSGMGLDISLSAARAASGHGIPVACGSLNDAPFAPGTFQLITMYHVLEHLSDPGAYLRSARVLLADDGRLVVQVPNASSWQAGILGKRWVGFDVPRHLHTFRDHDLRQLLRSHGFEVTRTKYFSLRDNPTSLATSLAPGLDPMARNVRGNHNARLAKDLAYLAITIWALPFAAIEAACRRGATVMVEAMKRS